MVPGEDLTFSLGKSHVKDVDVGFSQEDGLENYRQMLFQ